MSRRPRAVTVRRSWLTDEALKIHRDALLVDGHNDLPWQYRKRNDMSFLDLDMSRSQKKLHTDIPRLRKGNVVTQFWSAYVDVSTRSKAPPSATRSRKLPTGSIALCAAIPTRSPSPALWTTFCEFTRAARSVADRRRGRPFHRRFPGRTANVLSTRRTLMTLTHSETLDWADSATDKPKNNGLSPFGEQVVAEMRSPRHAGRSFACVGRHDEARAPHHQGAGHLFTFVRVCFDAAPAECAGLNLTL